ncbi:MAG TPA: arsenite methyltransferase [Negativicutes bacterium]|nr:arsenite methyltransferase [Negativicutes bacterium]
MNTMDKEEIRDKVRQRYAEAITAKNGCGCGGSSCCGSGPSKATQAVTGNLYTPEEVAGLSKELVEASFGCGNPTALTSLHAGEVVLDLGSGAGLDVILSARRVGPTGKAYGLDMTDEMLATANANKANLGVTNVEFLKGHIEEIPLPDSSVDVVISNCVINLSADKDEVFREIHRVLKPGGRMAVSDVVLLKPLPEWLQKNLAVWTGCIAGALSLDDYKNKLMAAGFAAPEVELTRVYDPADLGFDPVETKDAIGSAFIRAQKTKKILHEGADYNIRPAESSDFSLIHALLVTNDLPTAGVDPASGDYFVAVSLKQLVGVIGFEKYGSAAMLRSFAVQADIRKGGIGATLVNRALEHLKASNITPIYLLTNTAEQYMTQFGFKKIKREEIPPIMLENSTLGTACPSSSICMKLG